MSYQLPLQLTADAPLSFGRWLHLSEFLRNSHARLASAGFTKVAISNRRHTVGASGAVDVDVDKAMCWKVAAFKRIRRILAAAAAAAAAADGSSPNTRHVK
jgi:hypothetical protein